GEGAVWVPNTGDGTVSRIDPRSNRVVATLRIGNQLAFYQRDCEAKGSVHSFMGTSFHVRDCDLPSALAVGAGALWILKNDEQMLLRVDPRNQHVVARVPLEFVPFDMAATDNAVWITGYWVDQLVRVAGRNLGANGRRWPSGSDRSKGKPRRCEHRRHLFPWASWGGSSRCAGRSRVGLRDQPSAN